MRQVICNSRPSLVERRGEERMGEREQGRKIEKGRRRSVKKLLHTRRR
jgi:hypothetical protein